MDDIRFYVIDLLSRFRIGSAEMKKQALLPFNEVIREDERYVTVALQLDDIIGFLVNFLDDEIQQEAAKCGTKGVKMLAATCLLSVTENSENAWSILSHGGITALLKICSGGGGVGVELVALACAVLKNRVGVEEIKRFVMEEGGISLFINLAKCNDEIIKIKSVDLLQTMACNDESVKEMIIEEGGIRGLWDSEHLLLIAKFTTFAGELRFHGSHTLLPPTRRGLGPRTVVEDGVLGIGDFRRREEGDGGGRVHAGFGEASRLEIGGDSKKFVQSDQNLGLVLRMLEVNNAVNKNMLLSILTSLTSSSATARKKIATSGYLKHIEKLADAQFSDAKKIVRKMSSNR
ncbi:hypothetical protein SASPL_121324 [Salvia splendens]|uniref:Vacuolar protein 8 n=1 Tax=Salvia splendens TaxID=180675 RepID=A0A8X8XRA8_SALSN|nr:hypothetical protein SASPL_121324 [Salvia splendens]